MELSMDTCVDRQTNKATSLLPFSEPSYARVRRAFSDWVCTVYRLEVVGADRLPATGPAVVAPNHDSVLDGIVLGAAISRELRFLAKAELWRSRLLAWMLDGLGAIRIERGRSDHRALAQARRLCRPASSARHRLSRVAESASHGCASSSESRSKSRAPRRTRPRRRS